MKTWRLMVWCWLVVGVLALSGVAQAADQGSRSVDAALVEWIEENVPVYMEKARMPGHFRISRNLGWFERFAPVARSLLSWSDRQKAERRVYRHTNSEEVKK